jgi:hypothetical protein
MVAWLGSTTAITAADLQAHRQYLAAPLREDPDVHRPPGLPLQLHLRRQLLVAVEHRARATEQAVHRPWKAAAASQGAEGGQGRLP